MRWYERSNTRSDELHNFGPEHETQEEAVAWIRRVIAGEEVGVSISSHCRYVLGFPELAPVFTLPLDQIGIGEGKRRGRQSPPPVAVSETAQQPATSVPPPPPPPPQAPPPPALRVVHPEPDLEPEPEPAPDYSALTGDDEPAAAPESPVNVIESKFGQWILEVRSGDDWYHIPFSTEETAQKQAAKARDAILQCNATALSALVRRMGPGRFQGQ